MNWPNWKALIPWPVQPKLATLLQAAAGSCPIVAREGIHPKPASEWKSKVAACYWINGQSATSPCFFGTFPSPPSHRQIEVETAGAGPPQSWSPCRKKWHAARIMQAAGKRGGGLGGVPTLVCAVLCGASLGHSFPLPLCDSVVMMMISPSITPIRTLVVITLWSWRFW